MEKRPLGILVQFKQNWTVEQLEQRFAAEAKQISAFDFQDRNGGDGR